MNPRAPLPCLYEPRVTTGIYFFTSAETGDFKIDTTGTYHGMNLKSVTVSPSITADHWLTMACTVYM